jgi:hypothetical protein
MGTDEGDVEREFAKSDDEDEESEETREAVEEDKEDTIMIVESWRRRSRDKGEDKKMGLQNRAMDRGKL